MKTGWWKSGGQLLGFGVLVAVVAAQPASAQQGDQDCRCVDRDGNAIENCACLRMPRIEAMLGRVARPRLGISVSRSQGAELDARGAQVNRVLEDGPADDAGIQENDVITRIDGHSLFEPLPGNQEEDFDLDESIPVQRLLAVARDLEPGQDVEIEYLRDGERHTTTVRAEDLAASRGFGLAAPGWDPDRFREQMRNLNEGLRDLPFHPGGGRDPTLIGPPRMDRFGLEMVELNSALGEYFGTTRGVLVTDVDEDSRLGLRPGDVILRVGDEEVSTPDRVRALLGSYHGEEDVPLRIRRNGREIDVMGRVGR